jgi:hypothetical protein
MAAESFRYDISVVSGVHRRRTSGSKVKPIAGAFPIQGLVRSRPTLAGRLLLWGLVFRVRGRLAHVAVAEWTVALRSDVTGESPALQSS